MDDSRNLADLDPRVRMMAQQLLERADRAGIPLVVTFTVRSLASQAALYAQGRSRPGHVVTNARAGYSFHNFGLALDVVPAELLALPHWGNTPDRQARTNALWESVSAIGKSLGFRWGGDFHSIIDRPHFEWSGGLTLAQLRAGARPPSAAVGRQLAISNQPKGTTT